MATTNITQLSEKELQELLALKAKVEKEKKEREEKSKRYLAKQRLLVKKAVEAGITVTDAEIEAEVARAIAAAKK